MYISIEAFAEGTSIPAKFAFGTIPENGRFALSKNVNPAIAWGDAPADTRSFSLICHDPDVPSSGEDVNQEDKTVPADLPRIDFYHWVVANIPPTTTSIAEGADSLAVTAKGKTPGQRSYGQTGINSYTDWFAGDSEMAGDYGGYDGPCPPWNDSIIHHYHFTIYALDTAQLNLKETFDGPNLLAAMDGHILGKATHTGLYSMNPRIAGTAT